MVGYEVREEDGKIHLKISLCKDQGELTGEIWGELEPRMAQSLADDIYQHIEELEERENPPQETDRTDIQLPEVVSIPQDQIDHGKKVGAELEKKRRDMDKDNRGAHSEKKAKTTLQVGYIAKTIFADFYGLDRPTSDEFYDKGGYDFEIKGYKIKVKGTEGWMKGLSIFGDRYYQQDFGFTNTDRIMLVNMNFGRKKARLNPPFTVDFLKTHCVVRYSCNYDDRYYYLDLQKILQGVRKPNKEVDYNFLD